jgi:hypothetical protein
VSSGRSKVDALPALDIESFDADVPTTGVTVTAGKPRLPWGWIAIGGAALVFVLIVSGFGARETPTAAPAPFETSVPAAALTQAATDRSLAFVAGSVTATVRMSEIEPATHTVRFAIDGAGGAPAHWYYLQVGVCPDRGAVVLLGTPAGEDGKFGGDVDTHFLVGAPLWLRVLDGQGTKIAAGYTRLFQTEVMLAEPTTDVCRGMPDARSTAPSG